MRWPCQMRTAFAVRWPCVKKAWPSTSPIAAQGCADRPGKGEHLRAWPRGGAVARFEIIKKLQAVHGVLRDVENM